MNGIEGSTGRLGVELNSPYTLTGGLSTLDTFDRSVVSIEEERFPSLGERINELESILVVLRGNIDTSSFDVARVGEGEDRLIVATVTEPHPVSFQSGSETDDLVTHANTEDGLFPLVDSLAEVKSSLHAVLGVSGTVGEEETIELISNLVEVIVPGEDSDGSSSAGECTKNVGLGTEVEERDFDISVRIESVNLAGRNLIYEVLDSRIPVFRILRSDVVSSPDREFRQSRTTVSEESRDGSGVNAGDSRNAVAVAPLVEGLDSLVVRVLLSQVGNDDSSALDTVRFEHDGRSVGREVLGGKVVGNSVVSDEGRREDEELGAVRRVGHGFGVGSDRGRENRFTETRDGSAKPSSGERLARLEVESRRKIRVERVLGFRRNGTIGKGSDERRSGDSFERGKGRRAEERKHG